MLEEFGAFIYESVGVHSPKVFIISCITLGCLFGGLAGGFLGWKIDKEYNASLGEIKGSILFQDNYENNEPTSILIHSKGKLLQSLKASADGFFSFFLRHGYYSLQFKNRGYVTKEMKNIQSSQGTLDLEMITLEVAPKSVSITLSDKSKRPYPFIKLGLMKGTPPSTFDSLYIQ